MNDYDRFMVIVVILLFIATTVIVSGFVLDYRLDRMDKKLGIEPNFLTVLLYPL